MLNYKEFKLFLSGYGGMVHLDDCTFHECIKLDEFSDAKILTVRPPEGEVGMQNMLGHFRSATKLREGNDFSRVCHSVQGWGLFCAGP